MNNRGSIVLYSLMVSVVLIILALALAPAVAEFTNDAMNDTTSFGGQGLNCTNTSISDFNKAACIATDLTIFYFIGFIILLSGAIITARIIF